MLVGDFKYGSYIYGINAYDYGDVIVLRMNSPITKGISFADGGIKSDDGSIEIPATWDSIYASVGSGAITVDQGIYTEDGKKYKSRLNELLFSYLGSIIKGMKAGCVPDLLVTDDMFGVSFNPMKAQTYAYDTDCKITLELGIIKKLDFVDTDGVELHLEEDGSYETKIYQSDGCVRKKIKLDLSMFVKESAELDSDWDFTDDVKIYSLQEVIERNPDKNYMWVFDRKYEVVTDLKRVEQVCKMLWEHDGIVSFDTEATGLVFNVKCREGKNNRLVGLVFSIKPGEAFYFPIAHKKVKNICDPSNEQFIIEKYFKPILEHKPLLCHNGAFDWKVMYNYDICINLVEDTLILFKVTLWNDHTNLRLGLKPLTKNFLGRDSFELEDFVEGKFGNQVKFWDLPEDTTRYYACPDVDNSLELLNWAKEQDLLGKYDAKKVYEMEVAFSIVIAYQEYYGHCVDIDKIEDLVNAIKRDKEESYATMREMVGRDFNPKSAPDMQKVCFDILGLPVVGLTDSGKPSTGKDTRRSWLSSSVVSDENKNFVRCLNTYLDARTLESNFTKNIDKFATPDGLMFSEVEQFLATGRVSTKNPNYQGYSDTVKKYIVPRSGYYAMDADYSSVEARIMCSMAGCKAMVEKMSDPDMDYHRQKASDMFDVPYELVTDKLRKNSKGVNFGILYGLGDPNLGGNLFGVVSAENTRKASKYRELYFKGMEELRGFIEFSRNQGVQNHYSTTYFNRRRYFDPRKTKKSAIERQSCNARIQGTAADIYKLAMIRMFIEIRNRGWLGRVLMSGFVHDEVFMEVHKSINPAIVLNVLRKSMMLEIEGWCPLFTGMGYGRNWYEAKHTEIPVQVQEKIVNECGEIGFEWWDGNSDYLCEWTNDAIHTYMRDRVIDYMKNSDNYGKVLKPTENGLCNSVLGLLKKGVKIKGTIDNYGEVHMSNDMLEELEEFCRIFGISDYYEKANIQKPVHEEKSGGDVLEENEELEDLDEPDPIEMMLSRVNIMGVHSLHQEGGWVIYFKYDENNKVLMNLIRKTIDSMPGDSPVFAVKDGEVFSTGLSVDYKVYPKILQLCLANKNINKTVINR